MSDEYETPPTLPVFDQGETGDDTDAAHSTAVDETPDSLVLARATISMPGGISAGHEYWVDSATPYVKTALACGYFVPVEGHTIQESPPTP